MKRIEEKRARAGEREGEGGNHTHAHTLLVTFTLQLFFAVLANRKLSLFPPLLASFSFTAQVRSLRIRRLLHASESRSIFLKLRRYEGEKDGLKDSIKSRAYPPPLNKHTSTGRCDPYSSWPRRTPITFPFKSTPTPPPFHHLHHRQRQRQHLSSHAA